MANKYIDADELLNEVLGTMFSMSMCLSEQAWRGMKHAQQIFARMIETAPAADVVEVRRGNPIRHYQRFCNSDGEVIREIFDGWECPFCHSTGVLNYCPNCGAKMEEDRE